MKGVIITVVVIVIAALVVFAVLHFRKKPPQLDAFYLQSTDENGHVGYVHDIGVKKKDVVPGKTTSVQLLKTEIVNGVKKEMGRPSYVMVGHHPTDLRHKLYPESIEEHPLFYMVELKL